MNKFRMYACSIFATVLLIKVLGKRLRRRLDIKIASVPLPNSLYKQHTPSNSRAKIRENHPFLKFSRLVKVPRTDQITLEN